jgi:hypothetical protein
MRLTVEECVFILDSCLKTVSYAHCRQSLFENLEGKRQYTTRAIEEVNDRTLKKVSRNMVKRVDNCIEMNGHYFQHLLQVQVSCAI